jgi:hypothetical protein
MVALIVPVVLAARQTFKPAPAPTPQVTFKAEPKPQLTLDSGQGRAARLRHVSGKQTIEAEAQGVSVKSTATGLMIELYAGTYSTWNEPWQTTPQPFQTLQLEFLPNGELLSIAPKR